jgi:hypothetical protein
MDVFSLFSKAPDPSTFSQPVAADDFSTNFYYNCSPADWYKLYPFVFQIRDITAKASSRSRRTKDTDAGLQATFYLPIPPQSMTTQQLSTAIAHPTLGGVVEECSAPVFWTITLVGTTGMAMNGSDKAPYTSGRRSFEDVSGQKGVIAETAANLANKVLDTASSFITSEKSLPFGLNGSAVTTPQDSVVTELVSSAASTSNWATQLAKAASAGLGGGMAEEATPFSNGFIWDHALKNFFLIYQRERAKNPNLGLFFIDEKNRSAYRCVPRSVQFQKSSANPYVSMYTIILQCWDLKDSTEFKKPEAIDRFDPNKGDLKEVYTVTSTAMISSVMKSIRDVNRMSVSGVTQQIVSETLSNY